MQLDFLKMHGAGNRILVVDERLKNRPPPTPEQLRSLGNESTGPGFDQLMWVAASNNPSMVASYRVFNADGSEVEQCGNGVRCVAWMLARDSALQSTSSKGDQTEFKLESPAGPIEVRMLENERVSVSMGAPEFRPEYVPFTADEQSDRYTLQANGRELDVSVLSMGNPHCVIEVDEVATAEIELFGPLIEQHERFPERTNVGFMAVREADEIDLRVFERGVGETLACGTGACAAVVAARQLGKVGDKVRVNLPGGQLVVSWRGDADTVWLTGNAELISEGTIDL
jgi:diaminopimelate epimerase